MYTDIGGLGSYSGATSDMGGMILPARFSNTDMQDSRIGMTDPNIVYSLPASMQPPNALTDRSPRASTNVSSYLGSVSVLRQYNTNDDACLMFSKGTGNALIVDHREYLEPRQKDWYFKCSLRPANSFVPDNRFIAVKDNIGVSRGWLLIIEQTTGKMVFAIWSPGAVFTQIATSYNFVQTFCGKWVDIEVGCLSNSMVLIVNNVVIGYTPLTGPGVNPTGSPLVVGSGYTAGAVSTTDNNSFVGLMSDVVYSVGTPPRILNRPVLPSQDIVDRDPFFGSVSLQATCIGQNGTTVIDHSKYNHTITAAGNAQLDSGSLLLDGTGDYLSIPAHDSFDFGTEPFTWEAEVSGTNIANSPMILHQLDASSGTEAGWFLEIGPGNLYAGAGVHAPAFQTFPSGSIADGPFMSLCIERYDSTKLSAYVNGSRISEYTDALIGQSLSKTTPFVIGGGGTTFYPTLHLNGRIRNVRITKGVARYRGSYVPPTVMQQARSF